MTKKEKVKFINELVGNVKKDILKKVDQFPEEWDGIELRWYIKEQYAQVMWKDLYKTNSKRHGDFMNHCIVNNL